ncbi:MAG: hypothetical protein U0S12_11595 [Fimbriimonadales bacterium]
MADEFDPIDDRPSSSLVSFKDLKVVSIALVVFLAICSPVYLSCRRQSDKHLCKQNFRGIGNAMNLYAEANNGLLPPLYATVQGTAPLLDGKKHPFTWASLISEYMGDRSNFRCPSASSEENTHLQHRTDSDKEIECSYGMFAMRSAAATFSLRNPAQAVIVAETSNEGAQNTYNPVPLLDIDGNPTQDGFMIGFDRDNFAFDRDTRHVTRLAFAETKDGKFSGKGQTRHDGGNFFLFADGHAATLSPTAARTEIVGNQIDGLWSTR